jgi:hypothetical protein
MLMTSDSVPIENRLFTREQAVTWLFPRLLQKPFCSVAWLAAAFGTARKDGQVFFRYRKGVYPPGGKASLMRRCPVCGRTCPPNRPAGNTCCDCEAEAARKAFLSRLRTPVGRSIKEDLWRRWWRTPIPYVDFMACPTSEAVLGPLEEPERLTEAEEEGAYDFSEWSDGPLAPEDRPRRSSLCDHREALAIAVRWLDIPKKDGARHPGCQMVLLPENKKALAREIAYFRRTGRVILSAKRVSHPYRPFDPVAFPRDPPAS